MRLLVLALLVVAACASAADAPRPNIVLVLADDLGWGDLGCYGQQRIRTPNLDRLAAEGLRFTRAYAGSTVCAPSRACLFTGRDTGHASIRGNQRTVLPAKDPTLPAMLQEAGYDTALYGKWGLGDHGGPGDPNRRGFADFHGYVGHLHAHNHWPDFLWRNGRKEPTRNVLKAPTADGSGESTTRLDYADDLFLRGTLAFVRKPRSGPFFVMWSAVVPHGNNEAKGREMLEAPELGAYGAEDWPDEQRHKAAMITRLDAGVGEIAAALRATGLAERTLLLFTSDNGPHHEGADPAFFASSGGLRGIKRDLYEGGIRVPLIAWWPGRVAAGHVDEQPVAFWDLLPTCAELAGIPAPAGIQGISFAAALDADETTRRPAHEQLYWEFHENGFHQALLVGRWKAVRHGIEAPIELYDLAADPQERADVAGSHPEVVVDMAKRFAAARTDDPAWKPQPAPRRGARR